MRHIEEWNEFLDGKTIYLSNPIKIRLGDMYFDYQEILDQIKAEYFFPDEVF